MARRPASKPCRSRCWPSFRAGIALAIGLGKTLIGLRDMDRLLAASQLPDQAAGKPFLVAAPT